MDYLEWEFGCTINNVTVNGKIDYSSRFIGGVIGKLKDGTVSNCTNNSQITDTTYNAHAGIAGTMFQGDNEILNCSNTGTILGSSGVGGICGTTTINEEFPEKSCSISNCTNSGLIKSYGNQTDANSYAGGIGGTLGAKTRIENCTNLGEITGNAETTANKRNVAGGIAGSVDKTTIIASKNFGMIHCDVTSVNTDKEAGLGGIVGRCYRSGIEQCFNVGEITSSYKTYNVAGILGYSSGTTIKNSYNMGSVCGYNSIGGLVGRTVLYEEDGNYIYNSYNAAESVLGSSTTGNLAGNCTYITGNYTASITGTPDIGSN